MILGIGIDIVRVKRFEPWVVYPEHRLFRVFTLSEIDDCRDVHGQLVPEKLAVRFAAKEAFYKALSAALVKRGVDFKPFTLLAICPFVCVMYGVHGVPLLQVNVPHYLLQKDVLEKVTFSLSLAHEDHVAVATVLLERD